MEPKTLNPQACSTSKVEPTKQVKTPISYFAGKRNQRGFGLIEILIVLAIFAILSGIVYLNKDKIFGMLGKSEVETEVAILLDAMDLYKRNHDKTYTGMTTTEMSASGYIDPNYADGSGTNTLGLDVIFSVTTGGDGQMVYTTTDEAECRQTRDRVDVDSSISSATCSTAGALTIVKS